MRSHRRLESAPFHSIGGYAAWPCAAAPACAFDLLWISRAAAAGPRAHRILPTGEPSIAIRRRRDRSGGLAAIDVVVCAVYDCAFWYRPEPGEELIALRLKPEVSAALIGVDARDYRNTEPAPPPQGLLDRITSSRRAAETGGVEEVAAALINDISAAADADAIKPSLARRAAAVIRGSQGRVTMRFLAREFDVSERHLRRAFHNAVGCAPKTYARRARLATAAIAADAEAGPDWAQIALETGFHDQAHMIADYRALVGQTPAQNHRERRAGSAFSNTPAIA